MKQLKERYDSWKVAFKMRMQQTYVLIKQFSKHRTRAQPPPSSSSSFHPRASRPINEALSAPLSQQTDDEFYAPSPLSQHHPQRTFAVHTLASRAGAGAASGSLSEMQFEVRSGAERYDSAGGGMQEGGGVGAMWYPGGAVGVHSRYESGKYDAASRAGGLRGSLTDSLTGVRRAVSRAAGSARRRLSVSHMAVSGGEPVATRMGEGLDLQTGYVASPRGSANSMSGQALL